MLFLCHQSQRSYLYERGLYFLSARVLLHYSEQLWRNWIRDEYPCRSSLVVRRNHKKSWGRRKADDICYSDGAGDLVSTHELEVLKHSRTNELMVFRKRKKKRVRLWYGRWGSNPTTSGDISRHIPSFYMCPLAMEKIRQSVRAN